MLMFICCPFYAVLCQRLTTMYGGILPALPVVTPDTASTEPPDTVYVPGLAKSSDVTDDVRQYLAEPLAPLWLP